jgi:small subunit ribosomal protein S16
MAVKIRMTRMGRRHRPFFRINAVESREPRDGRILEKLGHYDPIEEDPAKQIVLNSERVRYWLDNGAIPSDTVSQILLRQGIKTKYAEARAARLAKARAIAASKGKLFNKAQKIAAQKEAEAAEEKANAEAQAKEKAKEEKAKAEEEKAKAQAEAKEKAEAEQKAKAEAEKAGAEVKEKTEAEVKEKTEAEEETKAEAAPEESEPNNPRKKQSRKLRRKPKVKSTFALISRTILSSVFLARGLIFVTTAKNYRLKHTGKILNDED